MNSNILTDQSHPHRTTCRRCPHRLQIQLGMLEMRSRMQLGMLEIRYLVNTEESKRYYLLGMQKLQSLVNTEESMMEN